MAGAATVAVRPKNGNAVIDFRPESAENSAGLPGSDRRSVGLYPQGGNGEPCRLSHRRHGSWKRRSVAGSRPLRGGAGNGGGAAVNPPPPGSRAQGRPLDPCLFACGNGPIACKGAAGMPDHRWKGDNIPPGGSRLSDGLKRVAGFRLPHSGRIRRISGGRFGSSCAGTPPPVADVRSAHDGALYTGRAGGQGRAATATPPEAPRQDFSGMRS